MSARRHIETYYEALHEDDPLASYFAPDTDVVKFGISEELNGYEAIREGLENQTRSTTDWVVDSMDLRVTERDRHAWFADRVNLAWTNTERRVRFEFETRWSGTLERHADDAPAIGADESRPAGNGDWRFVGMHVSTAGEV